jgi:sRNA-binding carbon storage regulator CsrA
MIEYTLIVGDKIRIGGDIIIEHVEKTHPKAILARVAKFGVTAPNDVFIKRGELDSYVSVQSASIPE